LGGKSLSFWYYADQALPADTVLTVSAGATGDGVFTTFVTGIWTQVSVDFPVNDDNRYNHFFVDFRTQTPPATPVTIYLDDFLLSP